MLDMKMTSVYERKACKECGAAVVDGSRTLLCRRCTARLSARAKSAERRAAGLCRRCGAPLDGTYKQCESCRAKRREMRRRESRG